MKDAKQKAQFEDDQSNKTDDIEDDSDKSIEEQKEHYHYRSKETRVLIFRIDSLENVITNSHIDGVIVSDSLINKCFLVGVYGIDKWIGCGIGNRRTIYKCFDIYHIFDLRRKYLFRTLFDSIGFLDSNLKWTGKDIYSLVTYTRKIFTREGELIIKREEDKAISYRHKDRKNISSDIEISSFTKVNFIPRFILEIIGKHKYPCIDGSDSGEKQPGCRLDKQQFQRSKKKEPQ